MPRKKRARARARERNPLRVKHVRTAEGLSLVDLAERLGFDTGTVARLQRPDYDPRASMVARLARALGVPACELFEDAEVRKHTSAPKARQVKA